MTPNFALPQQRLGQDTCYQAEHVQAMMPIFTCNSSMDSSADIPRDQATVATPAAS